MLNLIYDHVKWGKVQTISSHGAEYCNFSLWYIAIHLFTDLSKGGGRYSAGWKIINQTTAHGSPAELIVYV